jgi:CheY-like chemotaxis protein
VTRATETTDGITVLVADDEPDLLQLTRALLERAGFEVVEQAVDGEEALAAVTRLDPPPVPTVMVLDYLMPGLSGLEVADRVLARHPGQRIVLFSAFLDGPVRDRAEAMGVRCVSKSQLHELPRVVAALAS